MNNDTYKFKSHNTLEHIAFHDCVIKKAELFNKNLFIYFDMIYLLETHADNDIGNFKKTDNAMIRFNKTKVRKSQWHDMSKALVNASVANAHKKEIEQIESGLTSIFKLTLRK